MILDSSKLNDYLRCPRYFFYRHHLGWQSEETSNHLIFGSSVHLALESLLLGNSVQASFDTFLEDYRKTYQNPEMDDIFWPKTPENLFVILDAYAKYYKKDLIDNEVLYTEIAGTVAINESDSIALRMDSILRNHKTGKVFSLEHKTASSFYLWAEQWLLSVQVGTYTHALNCLFPIEEVEGVTMNGILFGKAKNAWQDIFNQKVPKKLPWDFDRVTIKKTNDQMQVWLHLVDYLVAYIEAELQDIENGDIVCSEVLTTFRMNPTACQSYNKMCEFHPFCCSWPNPLKKCHNVPVGYKIEFWNPLAKPAKKEITI